MTLTTHAIVGAAVASFFPAYPAAAFVLAFASHFPMDAIPHWDYHIHSSVIHPQMEVSSKIDRTFFIDLLRVGFDGLMGITLSYYFFYNPLHPYIFLIGAIGGMLPDPLQFVHKLFPYEPLASLQRFHGWIHSKIHLPWAIWSVGSQVVLATAVAFLFRLAY